MSTLSNRIPPLVPMAQDMTRVSPPSTSTIGWRDFFSRLGGKLFGGAGDDRQAVTPDPWTQELMSGRDYLSSPGPNYDTSPERMIGGIGKGAIKQGREMIMEGVRDPMSAVDIPGGQLADIGKYAGKLKMGAGEFGFGAKEVFRQSRKQNLSTQEFFNDLDEYQNMYHVGPGKAKKIRHEGLRRLYESGVDIDDLEAVSKFSDKSGTWSVEGGTLSHIMEDGRTISVEAVGPRSSQPRFRITVHPTTVEGGVIPGGKPWEEIANTPNELYVQIRDLVIRPPQTTELRRPGARSTKKKK